MSLSMTEGPAQLTLGRKLLRLNWLLPIAIAVVSAVGFAMLYSVADGNLNPWAKAQMVRFGVGFVLMFIVAMIARAVRGRTP